MEFGGNLVPEPRHEQHQNMVEGADSKINRQIAYSIQGLECHRVLDNRAQSTQQLLQIIREDLQQLQQAHENAQEDS